MYATGGPSTSLNHCRAFLRSDTSTATVSIPMIVNVELSSVLPQFQSDFCVCVGTLLRTHNDENDAHRWFKFSRLHQAPRSGMRSFSTARGTTSDHTEKLVREDLNHVSEIQEVEPPQKGEMAC
jgi:hypothetical protein